MFAIIYLLGIYLILPSNERYWQVDLVRFDRIVPVAGCGGCPGMFAFACRAKLHSINAGDGWCCNPP
jgi:hypothetical protein